MNVKISNNTQQIPPIDADINNVLLTNSGDSYELTNTKIFLPTNYGVVMKKLFLTILFCCAYLTSYAQEENPLDYFPHHVGDIWQYYMVPDGIFRESKITRIDTLESGRFRLIYFNNRLIPSYKIDVDSAVVYIIELNYKEHPWYFLNVPLKYYWERMEGIQWAGYGAFKENKMIWWEQYFSVKVFYIFNFCVQDTNFGYAGYAEFLAKNIGIWKYEWEGGEDALIGCLIDGVQYGTLVSVESENDIFTPQSFSISNYPNPFNGSTTISCSLPNAAFARIIIYDILGNEIETLCSDYKNAGKHTFVWTPGNISSGLYFAVLKTDKKIVTNKIIYLK
ncbi:MAG: T9SS type A sorting domain-containing protein [bacterium]